ERPLVACREARAAAAANPRRLDLLEQALGCVPRERVLEPGPRSGADQDRFREHAAPLGLARAVRAPGQHAPDDTIPGVDQIAVTDRRRGMAKAEADGLGQRHRAVVAPLAELEAQRLAQLVDMRVGGRGEARRAGADAQVAAG